MTVDQRQLNGTLRQMRKELRELFQQLTVDDAWVPVRVEDPGINDELAIALDRRPLRVWLLHDRGEPMIELGPPSWQAAYGPPAWRAFLTGQHVPALLPLQAEIEMFRSDLDSISQHVARGAVEEQQIREIAARQLRDSPPWGDSI